MGQRRYALRDDQWERIKDLLPGRVETVGVTAKDNRLFVEAVLYRYRAGIAWRDLPARFGDYRQFDHVGPLLRSQEFGENSRGGMVYDSRRQWLRTILTGRDRRPWRQLYPRPCLFFRPTASARPTVAVCHPAATNCKRNTTRATSGMNGGRYQ